MSWKIAALLAFGAGAAAALTASATTLVPAMPPWSEAPTVADMAAAYPARAKAENISGHVELTCEIGPNDRPRDCSTVIEKPGNYGFGAAARKLAEQMKVGQSGSYYHQNVFIPVTFDKAVLAGAPTVTKPAWASMPTAQDFQATFPKTENGVNDVRVVLGCTVGHDGALGGCAVNEEDPAGQGYGAGALALAAKFKVGPWSMDGEPTVGARINLPIRYELTPVKQ
ncbi:TonB family protein [Phenylobacterium sp.]|uniref:TonB family protein n=1 Tax=Phenylobacterium sp. TaxID=1871053 RepID=UPI0011F6096A|nr:TonB family protein [Phenylobacterium sp.]THD59104.1 MAG: TonB family protein [Phenylobacterium sp.]